MDTTPTCSSPGNAAQRKQLAAGGHAQDNIGNSHPGRARNLKSWQDMQSRGLDLLFRLRFRVPLDSDHCFQKITRERGKSSDVIPQPKLLILIDGFFKLCWYGI